MEAGLGWWGDEGRDRAGQSELGLACACLPVHVLCQGLHLGLRCYSFVNIPPFQVSLFCCFDYKSDTFYKTSFCDLEQGSQTLVCIKIIWPPPLESLIQWPWGGA